MLLVLSETYPPCSLSLSLFPPPKSVEVRQCFPVTPPPPQPLPPFFFRGSSRLTSNYPPPTAYSRRRGTFTTRSSEGKKKETTFRHLRPEGRAVCSQVTPSSLSLRWKAFEGSVLEAERMDYGSMCSGTGSTGG
eukprot:Sspe_Gene.94461::Locus_66836_Transcript_1_1_Confidence_1.000_Length_632::g.94461::m.94461